MTLKSSREIDAVFQSGRRYATQTMVALIAETPEGRGPSGRVAFMAGKKLGTAVLRNRSKRVLREAVRRVGGPWPGYDVVLIARPRTAAAPPAELDDALRVVAQRSGMTPS